jgi:hypothetical protein
MEAVMNMTSQSFSRLAAVIFTLGALAQLSRALVGFNMMAGSMMVPLWASWLAAIVLGLLAWAGFMARSE